MLSAKFDLVDKQIVKNRKFNTVNAKVIILEHNISSASNSEKSIEQRQTNLEREIGEVENKIHGTCDLTDDEITLMSMLPE